MKQSGEVYLLELNLGVNQFSMANALVTENAFYQMWWSIVYWYKVLC
jgi:hypothetical protein